MPSSDYIPLIHIQQTSVDCAYVLIAAADLFALLCVTGGCICCRAAAAHAFSSASTTAKSSKAVHLAICSCILSQGLCDVGVAYMHHCCSKAQSEQSLPYATSGGMLLTLIVTSKT